MKIGFYIHHTNLQAGGIFTYSIGVLKLLLGSDEIDKIVLVISTDQKEYFSKFADNKKIKYLVIDRNKFFVKIRLGLSYFLFDNFLIYKGYFNNSQKLVFLKKLSTFINPYKKLVKSKKIDLLHIPLQYSPIYGGDIPLVITMHDLQEFHFPENFGAAERLHRSINSKKAVEESDHVIVSFDHIRRDILKYFNIAEGKVSVCEPPFYEDWFLAKKYTSEEDLIEMHRIENKFILYPAATWKHKNHLKLIQAIDILTKKSTNIQLICTGNKTEYYRVLEDEINRRGLTNKIKFLGIVPEEDLIGLYKCTSLVVIPTLYEAGSGPLYEAMRYSTPVICSNITSLPETMGNDEFIFNPEDEIEMATKIELMLTDENVRSSNIKNSVERINYLRGKNYIESFITVYKKLLNKKI